MVRRQARTSPPGAVTALLLTAHFAPSGFRSGPRAEPGDGHAVRIEVDAWRCHGERTRTRHEIPLARFAEDDCLPASQVVATLPLHAKHGSAMTGSGAGDIGKTFSARYESGGGAPQAADWPTISAICRAIMRSR